MTAVEDDANGARRGPRRIQAVDHAVDVLECLGKAGGPLGVSDIARQTGLSKATAHHLLATLEARRLVMRDGPSPLYRLGWSLYELGSSVVRSIDLSRVARPFLDQLAVSTGESVLLAIRDEDSILYLDRANAPTGFHMVATAGRRGSLHATASGKVLLAFAPADEIDRYLSGSLQEFTRTTVTDPAVLREQLTAVRDDGFATCWEEREPGLCSLAVPVRDHSGDTVASLALAGPVGRVTPEGVDDHVAALREVTVAIETQLGVNHAVGAGS